MLRTWGGMGEMKATTCAIMTGCLFLMMGAVASAAEAQGSKPVLAAEGEQIAQMGESHNQAQLRAWVNSIKPAAGHVEPAQQRNEYWQQSVIRGNRGRVQE